MNRAVLVLRPQPGADATAKRARTLGMTAIVAPLFKIQPRAWAMPDAPCDALLVTSANAARMLDDRLDRRTSVYAVGAATATALRARGFASIVEGGGGAAEIVARARADGITSLLHLAGADRTAFDAGLLRIETRIVYAAAPCAFAPEGAAALAAGGIALLHSARAARRLRELAGSGHRIAAISAAVLAAAGAGWDQVVTADRPTDDALLAAAARLCQ